MNFFKINTSKIIFLILFSVLFITSISSAQTKIGISTGANLTSISGDAPKDGSYTGSPGLILGLSGEFNITKSLKIVIQPGYVQRNGKINYEYDRLNNDIDSFSTSMSYVNLPVLLKVPALNNVTYFNGGFSVSYLTQSSLKYLVTNQPTADLDSLVNKFDFSLLFGFGATIHIYKNIGLDLEARYTQSIVNLSSGNTTFGTTLPVRFRSSGFQFLTNILYSF